MVHDHLCAPQVLHGMICFGPLLVVPATRATMIIALLTYGRPRRPAGCEGDDTILINNLFEEGGYRERDLHVVSSDSLRFSTMNCRIPINSGAGGSIDLPTFDISDELQKSNAATFIYSGVTTICGAIHVRILSLPEEASLAQHIEL